MIQVLLDENPKSSWQELAPQIHAISDETHREIHAQFEKAVQQRRYSGGENRRSAPPAAASRRPSSWAST
jgi:hypothetical protein